MVGTRHQPARIYSTEKASEVPGATPPESESDGSSISSSISSDVAVAVERGNDDILSKGDSHDVASAPHIALPATPPKACLALIMKNEGPILPRLFGSVKGFVSEYCVVDTGSTDDTMDVLRSIDMPGVLVEEPFVDFATTRNFLLDTCRQQTTCEYLVLLDADMVLRVSPDWDWAKLDGADVYDFVQVSSIEYANVRMVKRTADRIKVVGATHEYYDVPSEYSHKLLPKHLIHIDDVGDGKAKGDKFQRDERLLRRELEKEPDNVRTVFYLANTLKDQGKYREAIPFYERRATMGGWYAEADYSWFMLSSCYLALHDVDKAREYAEKAAFEGWFKRAEPLYYLAFHFHQGSEYALAWYYATLASQIPKPDVSTVLFISYPIYDYWIEYERASLCRHLFPADLDFCLRIAMAFLNNPSAPEDLRQYFLPDLAWYLRPLLSAGTAVDLLPDSATGIPFFAQAKKSDLELALVKDNEQGGQSILRTALGVLNSKDDPPTLAGTPAQRLSVASTQYDGAQLTPLGPADGFVGGPSRTGDHVFMGEWPGPHDGAQLDLKRYTVMGGDASTWALFSKPGAESAFCVSSWYPTLEVGALRFDEASSSVRYESVKSTNAVPRVFSRFHKTSHGVAYRGDIWFLTQWRHAERSGGSGDHIYSLVMIGPNFEVRSYTLPFTLDGTTKGGDQASGRKEMDPDLVIIRNEGREHLVVAFSYEEAASVSKGAAVKMLPIAEVLKRVVLDK
jgi:tetratricopeptide (TPR) repeat protein